MLGKCSIYEGLQNPTDPSKCCASDCLDYCGARNCDEKSGDRCCGSGIQNQICGTPGATNAPCTLGTTTIM